MGNVTFLFSAPMGEDVRFTAMIYDRRSEHERIGSQTPKSIHVNPKICRRIGRDGDCRKESRATGLGDGEHNAGEKNKKGRLGEKQGFGRIPWGCGKHEKKGSASSRRP